MAIESFLLILLGMNLILGTCVYRLRRVLQQVQERAARAEKLAAARGRCLTLAAQEMRGPALSLLSTADLMTRRHGTAEDAAAVESASHQLLRLADDMSDFAADATPRSLREAQVALGPVVDAAIATVAAQIRPGRRHWNVAASLREVTVHADPRALQGAIAALLRRAARQSRDMDMISLHYVLADETLAIVVEDEGDGLPALDLGLDMSGPISGTRGLDLGLTLARSLAAAHGGDLKLETVPGIGARAWLTLPRNRLLQAV